MTAPTATGRKGEKKPRFRRGKKKPESQSLVRNPSDSNQNNSWATTANGSSAHNNSRDRGNNNSKSNSSSSSYHHAIASTSSSSSAAALSYPEHVSEEVARRGVEDGTLFEATIRYNASDRGQAYCSVEGVDTDIFIEGALRQNRSVHGDLVVVRILEERDWWKAGGGNVKNGRNVKSGKADKDNGKGDVEVSSHALNEEMEGLAARLLSLVELNSDGGNGGSSRNGDNAIVQRVQKALSTNMKGFRATGEVVYIKKASERRLNMVGCLRDVGPQSTRAVFVPLDGRLPLCIVVEDAGKDAGGGGDDHDRRRAAAAAPYCHARDRGSAIAQHYFEAKIVRWDASGSHGVPEVRLKTMLGKPGQLETDVQALLMAENVNDDDLFDEEILACLPATPWTIPAEEFALRRDLRKTRIFSIDPETAKDLDDALSIEPIAGGLYQVGVHIADVSYFVKPGTALDEAAQVRSTSVYLVDRVIPMLPRLLCEELCSLNPGTERLAMSIIWKMKGDGEIVDVWMGRTVINSCVKLSYGMAQTVIDAFEAAEGSGQAGAGGRGALSGVPTEVVDTFMTSSTGATPEVFGNHTKAQVAGDVVRLHKIARALRNKRYANGSLRLDNSKVGVRLVEGDVDDFSLYVTGSANHLVEEFMLAANISAAEYISSEFPDQALLRRHPEPNMDKLVKTAEAFKQYLPDAPVIDTTSAGAVQASLARLRAYYRDRPEIVEAITFMCTKPMQMAEYFNTSDLERRLWRHYALAIPMYTHFTSPIRRYPDIIVHRLIEDAIKDTTPAVADVSLISLHSNERKSAAKVCQEKVTTLYLVKLLLERPRVLQAVVSGLGGPRFFEVYIPDLGTDIRVQATDLFAGAGRELQAKWDGEARSLALKIAEGQGPRLRGRGRPAYPSANALENPDGLEPLALPTTLTLFSRVPVVVYGRRGDLGEYKELAATIWLC